MMRFSILFLLSILIACSAAHAQDAAETQFKPTLANVQLEEGDTFVFLGDSITHQCLYTQYVEDYFYTRYPNTRIQFHNSGVGGDRANDALVRFDDDVAKFKPKYVSILLGMNDGTYTNFKQDVFDTYEKDMTELLDRLDGIGAKAIPMTPTMFDSRAAKIRDKGKAGRELRNNYYNAVLSFYGMWLQEQAFDRGLGFVDMHSPLNDLTIEQRKSDPNFTLIKDAVHPGPNGQVVMALAVLEDMHPKRTVSSVRGVKSSRGKWKFNTTGCEVSDVEGEEDKLRFTLTANALPWVLPAEAAEGYKLTKAGSKMSREQLRIDGLEAGKKYSLKIDGAEVGQYWPSQLADGVMLQANKKTPQYQQALAVAELNKERNDKAYHKIRDFWGKRKRMKRAIDRAKDDAAKAEKQKAWDEWIPTFDEELAKLQTLAKEYEDKIYAANKPKPHVYELSR